MNWKISIYHFIKDVMLYISAFVPMYFLILIKLFIELSSNNLKFNALFIIYLASLLLFIVLGILGLIINTIFSNDITKQILNVDGL